MKEIVRYILETVVCSGILYGAYLLFLRNRTGYLAARLCLTGSLLAAALIPLLRIPVWPGKVIYATAGTPAETTFTAPPFPPPRSITRQRYGSCTVAEYSFYSLPCSGKRF